jgi:hypothetical protein
MEQALIIARRTACGHTGPRDGQAVANDGRKSHTYLAHNIDEGAT